MSLGHAAIYIVILLTLPVVLAVFLIRWVVRRSRT